jgi:DNA polymerase-3 subunit beta
MSAVRRVAVLADTLTHQVRLTLSKKKVELVVSTPDVGEAREEIPGSFSSDAMEVGYNANYLQDVLKHMDADSVRVMLGTAVGAAIISAVDEAEGEEYLCLLMPLRLTS